MDLSHIYSAVQCLPFIMLIFGQRSCFLGPRQLVRQEVNTYLLANLPMNLFQWVTFVLMFQAASFILPYKLWQCMEGGLLAEFGLDANSRILLEVI